MSTSSTTDCCPAPETTTPLSVVNRPGLSALAYRAGTHASFKHSMIATLARQPALRGLTTRNDNDPSIALLDGWAAVLDVLTFYQERIANEGFLRTATERRSLLEMARAIGYELGPGVAASTWLAFTLDAPLITTTQAVEASMPTEVTIAIGTKAQSIPGQDELPQTFETVEEIIARAEWNALKPRASRPLLPELGATYTYISGTASNLKPGDGVLIVGRERAVQDAGSERWDFRRLQSVEPDFDRGITKLTWPNGLGHFRFGRTTLPAGTDPEIHAFRTRAAIFGHNAPDWGALPESMKADYVGDTKASLSTDDKSEWPRFKIYAPKYPPQWETPQVNGRASTHRPLPVLTTDSIDLDATYPAVIADSWIVLSKPDYLEAYEVKTVTEATRAQFLLSGKTTRLKLEGENLDKYADDIRTTTVFAHSEKLAFGEEPITDDVSGLSVELETIVDGLTPGRLVSLTGVEVATGEIVSEVVALDRTEDVDGFTRLYFTTALQHTYERDGLTLNANVAPATHGETKLEILGSGVGAEKFQKFALKFKPLTFVSAATPSGAASTITVRVNGVLWEETSSFYGAGPEDRVYLIRRTDDGTTIVQFGDGITGARLPSGQDNVTAQYRTGIGTGALLKTAQISLLMSQPLGVKETINPEAPTGAADPEDRDQARENAPLTVLTLDRVVSLQDYEDFARAFAGIAKAIATLLWDGERRLVHLTVAGPDAAAVEPTSALHENLIAAIDGARHPAELVRLATFAPLTFKLSALLKIDPDYIVDDVLADARASLEETFSFARRSFGQALTASEVIAALQAVDGVLAVVLERLHFSHRVATREERLPAAIAHWDTLGANILPAELLTLDSTGLELTELTGV